MKSFVYAGEGFHDELEPGRAVKNGIRRIVRGGQDLVEAADGMQGSAHVFVVRDGFGS